MTGVSENTAPQQETDAASILCGKWDAGPRNQISENCAPHHSTATHAASILCKYRNVNTNNNTNKCK